MAYNHYTFAEDYSDYPNDNAWRDSLLGNQNPQPSPLGTFSLQDLYDGDLTATGLLSLSPTSPDPGRLDIRNIIPQADSLPQAPNVPSPGPAYIQLQQSLQTPQTSQHVFSADNQDAMPHPLPTPLPTPEQKPRIQLIADRTKTRAETQIQLDMIFDPLPARFKRVRFPKKTLAKPKHYANEKEKAEAAKDGDTLDMDVLLVLATATQKKDQENEALKRARGEAQVFKRPANIPLSDLDKADPSHPQNGGEIVICNGCKEREEKRYNRKKKKSPEDEREWDQYKDERVIIINEKEYKSLREIEPDLAREFRTSQRAKTVTFHMRIACYCRHQEEKSPLGYRVVFTFRDSQRNLIAQHISTIFQITDDHKNKDVTVGDFSWGAAPAPTPAPLLTSFGRPALTHYPTPAARIPPSLASPGNMTPQATYGYGAPISAYSQPTTPISTTFPNSNHSSISSISPVQSTFAHTQSPTQLPAGYIYDSFPGSNVSTPGRTSAFDNSTTYFPPAYSTNVPPQSSPDRPPYPIPRVVSAPSFPFQSVPTMQYNDYASAPQSASTTPITQSRPASPTWEQNVPKKARHPNAGMFSLSGT